MQIIAAPHYSSSFLLSVAVARIFCPRAAKLPGHPGEGGGGACAGSGAKIQRVSAEAPTGPETIWPLTPTPLHLITCHVMNSGRDWPLEPFRTGNLFRDWSRGWTCLTRLHTHPNTQSASNMQMHTLTQDATPSSPPPQQLQTPLLSIE